MTQRTRMWALSMFLVAGVILILSWRLDPRHMELTQELKPPSWKHWLGTGENGIDILSQLLWGARLSLGIGLLSTAMSACIGTVLGIFFALSGGAIEQLGMRVIEIVFAFPGILLALLIAALLPPSVFNVVIAISATGWASFARLSRAQVRSVIASDFIMAARALGASKPRLIFRHLLAQTATPVLIQATLNMPGAILAEANLSFLGVGMPIGTPSWGALIDQGTHYLLVAPHVAIAPGIVLTLTVWGLTRLGESLRLKIS